MSVRAYVLLDVTNGSHRSALQKLRDTDGVVLVDWLEGRPDIIATVEAPDRQRLADLLMPVIACVDGVTEDLHLLVSRDNGSYRGICCLDGGKARREEGMRGA